MLDFALLMPCLATRCLAPALSRDAWPRHGGAGHLTGSQVLRSALPVLRFAPPGFARARQCCAPLCRCCAPPGFATQCPRGVVDSIALHFVKYIAHAWVSSATHLDALATPRLAQPSHCYASHCLRHALHSPAMPPPCTAPLGLATAAPHLDTLCPHPAPLCPCNDLLRIASALLCLTVPALSHVVPLRCNAQPCLCNTMRGWAKQCLCVGLTLPTRALPLRALPRQHGTVLCQASPMPCNAPLSPSPTSRSFPWCR